MLGVTVADQPEMGVLLVLKEQPGPQLPFPKPPAGISSKEKLATLIVAAIAVKAHTTPRVATDINLEVIAWASLLPKVSPGIYRVKRVYDGLLRVFCDNSYK
jgi:hypothetical protein